MKSMTQILNFLLGKCQLIQPENCKLYQVIMGNQGRSHISGILWVEASLYSWLTVLSVTSHPHQIY